MPIGSIKRDPGTEVGGEVFVPLKTGQRLFGERQVKIRSGGMDAQEVQLHEIIIAVELDQDVPMIANASRLMLADSHREKDYEVIDLTGDSDTEQASAAGPVPKYPSPILRPPTTVKSRW